MKQIWKVISYTEQGEKQYLSIKIIFSHLSNTSDCKMYFLQGFLSAYWFEFNLCSDSQQNKDCHKCAVLL